MRNRRNTAAALFSHDSSPAGKTRSHGGRRAKCTMHLYMHSRQMHFARCAFNPALFFAPRSRNRVRGPCEKISRYGLDGVEKPRRAITLRNKRTVSPPCEEMATDVNVILRDYGVHKTTRKDTLEPSDTTLAISRSREF